MSHFKVQSWKTVINPNVFRFTVTSELKQGRRICFSFPERPVHQTEDTKTISKCKSCWSYNKHHENKSDATKL